MIFPDGTSVLTITHRPLPLPQPGTHPPAPCLCIWPLHVLVWGGVTQRLAFCVCLIPRSSVASRPVPVSRVRAPSLREAARGPGVQPHHVLCVRPSVDGRVAGVRVLAVGHTAAVSVGVPTPVHVPVFGLGGPPGRGVAGSYGRSVCNFLRNLHAVFRPGCATSLRPRCPRVPASPRPRQHVVVPVGVLSF